MAVYDVLPETNLNLDDIRDTLNANGGNVTNDVVSFFSEDAKINQWSLRKPFVDDSWSPTNIINFTDTWKSGFYWRDFVGSTVKQLYYRLPTGSYSEPYRLGDFRGYNSKAKEPSLQPSSWNTTVTSYDGAENLPSQLVFISIRDLKPIMRMIRDELGLTHIQILGQDSTQTEMPLDDETDDIMHLPQIEIYPPECHYRNPGVPNVANHIIGFYRTDNKEVKYVFDWGETLAFRSSTVLEQYPTSNPLVPNTLLMPGHIVYGQIEFLLAPPPITQGGSLFDVNYITATWYELNSSGKIDIYISMFGPNPYHSQLMSQFIFIEEAGQPAGLRLKCYYGHIDFTMENESNVIKDGDFLTYDTSQNGLCNVEYYEEYNGSNIFRIPDFVFENAVSGMNLYKISTPYLCYELNDTNGIIVTQIIPKHRL